MLDYINQQGIEIHVRSVFLQGMAFVEPDDAAVFSKELKVALEVLKKIESTLQLSRAHVLLLFPSIPKEVGSIVVGTDRTR